MPQPKKGQSGVAMFIFLVRPRSLSHHLPHDLTKPTRCTVFSSRVAYDKRLRSLKSSAVSGGRSAGRSERCVFRSSRIRRRREILGNFLIRPAFCSNFVPDHPRAFEPFLNLGSKRCWATYISTQQLVLDLHAGVLRRRTYSSPLPGYRVDSLAISHHSESNPWSHYSAVTMEHYRADPLLYIQYQVTCALSVQFLVPELWSNASWRSPHSIGTSRLYRNCYSNLVFISGLGPPRPFGG